MCAEKDARNPHEQTGLNSSANDHEITDEKKASSNEALSNEALPDETLSGIAGGAIGSYGDEPYCPRCGMNDAVSLMWRLRGTDCWECSRCNITWQASNCM